MNCYHCQKPIAAESRFCASCGALVPDVTLPAVPADELDDSGARELELLIRAETAGEYEILREIGRGAMGVVYLAREMALARDVAMKVLPPHLTYGKGAIGRFRREARTAAALEHPNIIPIYRIAPGGRVFWYTMKYLEGRSLAELLQERRVLPLAATVTILERIADALDYAHQRHVIHRDVKPANVMLDPRGHVVVMDFGIAKEATAGTLAQSEAILGTPYYMSPEQCRGAALTGTSDQYSLGVMAYQMLSGGVPFDGKTVPDLLQQHCTAAPPPLKTVQPGLPEHVYAAVERAMAKDPAERFGSVGAFVRALVGPTLDSTMRLSLRHRVSATLLRVSRQHHSRHRTRDLVLLVAVGLGAALAARGLWRTPRPPSPASPPTQGAPPTPRGVDHPVSESLPAPAPVAPARRAASLPRRSSAVIPALPEPTAGSRDRTAPRSVLLVIQTVGGWGKLYVDGAFRGEGTAYRDTVTAGAHRLRVERQGYRSLDTTVTVRAGDTVLVRLLMRRADS